ncbi:MAG: hypothetical protein ACOYOV_11100 [Bacteroidales bacterium]
MKEVLKKMESLQVELEVLVDKREEYYGTRSEKWCDSEKGEEYQEKTDRLSEMKDEVSDWMSELGE